MDFHGIEMIGKFYNQIVADASALVWQASDEGRAVYDQTTESVWIADSSKWKKAGVSFAVGGDETASKLWFYQNVAPDGWVIDEPAGDSLMAVRYAAGSTYNTGGVFHAGVGITDIMDHNHTIAAEASHTHPFTAQTGFEQIVGVNRATGGTSSHTHTVTGTTDAGSSHNHGGSAVPETSGIRPKAHVGIICHKIS